MTTIDQIKQLLNEYPGDGNAHRWHQPKSDGDTRPIAIPNKELKKWLRKMNKALSRQFSAWPEFMHGGIKKRSYVSYARVHVGSPWVVTIDIKKCFDSITENEVAEAMQRHLQLDSATSLRLAKLLCFNGKLPQGFPTSNYLCNLYLLDPLSALHADLKAKGIYLNNYVDDLALSGGRVAPDVVINAVAVALSRAKLKMNKAKVSVMPSSQRQIVCGLVVNKRLSLTKALRRELFRDIANGQMDESRLEGWIANLQSVDILFRDKLRAFALKKGVIKADKT